MTDPQMLRAQADRILELHETGQLDAALAACEQLLSDVPEGTLDDEVVRESVFTARFERGVLLTELGELDAAAEAYAAAAATPTDLEDPDQRHELAMALLNQAICFDTLEDPEAALRVYDRLVVQLGDATDPVTADQVVRARVNRSAALLSLGRIPEALTSAEALQVELDPEDVLEAEQLAMAARLRASALGELGRLDDAATVLAEVERCSVEEPGARRQIVAAAAERARLLIELDREGEAIELLERTEQRHAGDADPDVSVVVDDLLQVEAAALERAGEHDRAARVRERVGG